MLTTTEGVHERLCEPLTEAAATCPRASLAPRPAPRAPTQKLCPPRHTCSALAEGFLARRGARSRGVHITIEAGTPYVELGASATDNLMSAASCSAQIVRREVGAATSLWSRALSNSAVDHRVLWNQLPEFVKL